MNQQHFLFVVLRNFKLNKLDKRPKRQCITSIHFFVFFHINTMAVASYAVVIMFLLHSMMLSFCQSGENIFLIRNIFSVTSYSLIF